MTEPSAATPPTMQEHQALCSMCPNVATGICTVCCCTCYCSNICQEDDWPVHKLLCTTYKDFAMPPSPNHFRATYFADDENKPRFVWVELVNAYVPNIGRMAGILCYDTLPLRYRSNGPPSPAYSKKFNHVLKRAYAKITLYVRLVRDEHGDRKLNGQVTASVGSIDKELPEIYNGPLLFHGDNYHLDMIPFRHIIDDMRNEYHHEYMKAEAELQGSIQGGRVNCTGDCDITGRPEFEVMMHANDILTMASQLSIPVTDKIGLPLNVFPLKSALTWRHRSIQVDEKFNYHDNCKTRCLNPARWYLQTGSVCLVRKDKKPLHIAHVEALLDYCVAEGFTIKQLYIVPNKRPGVDMNPYYDSNYQASAKQLLARATKEGFSEVFAVYMDGSGRRKYGDVRSPYDV
jgi:hypothetical protein